MFVLCFFIFGKKSTHSVNTIPQSHSQNQLNSPNLCLYSVTIDHSSFSIAYPTSTTKMSTIFRGIDFNFFKWAAALIDFSPNAHTPSGKAFSAYILLWYDCTILWEIYYDVQNILIFFFFFFFFFFFESPSCSDMHFSTWWKNGRIGRNGWPALLLISSCSGYDWLSVCLSACLPVCVLLATTVNQTITIHVHRKLLVQVNFLYNRHSQKAANFCSQL